LYLRFVPPYTPEWAGSVERMNRSTRFALGSSCDGDYSEWCTFLHGILFGIRSSVNSRTGHSPYYLVYGVHASLPLFDGLVETAVDLVARLLELESLPGVHAELIRESQSSSAGISFLVSSYVMILDPTLRKRKTDVPSTSTQQVQSNVPTPGKKEEKQLMNPKKNVKSKQKELDAVKGSSTNDGILNLRTRKKKVTESMEEYQLVEESQYICFFKYVCLN
jgi:hypothetical protein